MAILLIVLVKSTGRLRAGETGRKYKVCLPSLWAQAEREYVPLSCTDHHNSGRVLPKRRIRRNRSLRVCSFPDYGKRYLWLSIGW